MTKSERTRIRELTMGCWWPRRAFPKPGPDWNKIALELLGKAKAARFHGFTAEAEEAQRLADAIVSLL